MGCIFEHPLTDNTLQCPYVPLMISCTDVLLKGSSGDTGTTILQIIYYL